MGEHNFLRPERINIGAAAIIKSTYKRLSPSPLLQSRLSLRVFRLQLASLPQTSTGWLAQVVRRLEHTDEPKLGDSARD